MIIVQCAENLTRSSGYLCLFSIARVFGQIAERIYRSIAGEGKGLFDRCAHNAD